MTESSPELYGQILGPMELQINGVPAVVRAPKERLLLAIFMCHPRAVLTPSQLVDALWGESPPRTARKNLQVLVSALRKIVGDRLVYEGWGYRLSVSKDELDLLRFEDLARAGRQAMRNGDAAIGTGLMADAIGLWGDDPLAEFADSFLIAQFVDQLTERFLSLYEDWVEHEIAEGRYVDVMEKLDAYAARFPSRERLVGARMAALTLCGRTPEAIDQYMALRRHLAEEFGIDPNPNLCSLYEDILSGRISAGQVVARGGAALGVAHSRPNQLPHDVSDFVGRTDEVGHLVRTDASLVVITGEAGVGKTTLVVHAAHRLCPEFPDGVRMIVLGERASTAEGICAIQRENLEAAGVRLGETDSAPVIRAVWRSSLADQQLLMLLDDAPGEDAVRAFLPGTTKAKVLVTSRRRLTGLESAERVVLDEFGVDEGNEFLARVIGRDRQTAHADAIAELMRTWGRSPATLRIIGQRLAGMPGPQFKALLTLLVTTHDVIDEFVAGDQSLRQIFMDCYGSPDWEHREAFMAIGKLPCPPFRDDHIESALRQQGPSATRAIEALLEANVLRHLEAESAAHAVQYTMSPLVHSFAVELARSQSTFVSVTDRDPGVDRRHQAM